LKSKPICLIYTIKQAWVIRRPQSWTDRWSTSDDWRSCVLFVYRDMLTA